MDAERTLIEATVVGVNDSNVLYPCCIQCYAKMLHNLQQNFWQCTRCNITCSSSQLMWRYRLSLCVADSSATCHVSLFGGILAQHFGCPAGEFQRFLSETSFQGQPLQIQGELVVMHALELVLMGERFLFGLKLPAQQGHKAARQSQKPVCLADLLSRRAARSQVHDGRVSDFVAVQMIHACVSSPTSHASVLDILKHLCSPTEGSLSNSDSHLEAASKDAVKNYFPTQVRNSESSNILQNVSSAGQKGVVLPTVNNCSLMSQSQESECSGAGLMFSCDSSMEREFSLSQALTTPGTQKRTGVLRRSCLSGNTDCQLSPWTPTALLRSPDSASLRPPVRAKQRAIYSENAGMIDTPVNDSEQMPSRTEFSTSKLRQRSPCTPVALLQSSDRAAKCRATHSENSSTLDNMPTVDSCGQMPYRRAKFSSGMLSSSSPDCITADHTADLTLDPEGNALVECTRNKLCVTSTRPDDRNCPLQETMQASCEVFRCQAESKEHSLFASDDVSVDSTFSTSLNDSSLLLAAVQEDPHIPDKNFDGHPTSKTQQGSGCVNANSHLLTCSELASPRNIPQNKLGVRSLCPCESDFHSKDSRMNCDKCDLKKLQTTSASCRDLQVGADVGADMPDSEDLSKFLDEMALEMEEGADVTTEKSSCARSESWTTSVVCDNKRMTGKSLTSSVLVGCESVGSVQQKANNKVSRFPKGRKLLSSIHGGAAAETQLRTGSQHFQVTPLTSAGQRQRIEKSRLPDEQFQTKSSPILKDVRLEMSSLSQTLFDQEFSPWNSPQLDLSAAVVNGAAPVQLDMPDSEDLDEFLTKVSTDTKPEPMKLRVEGDETLQSQMFDAVDEAQKARLKLPDSSGCHEFLTKVSTESEQATEMRSAEVARTLQRQWHGPMKARDSNTKADTETAASVSQYESDEYQCDDSGLLDGSAELFFSQSQTSQMSGHVNKGTPTANNCICESVLEADLNDDDNILFHTSDRDLRKCLDKLQNVSSRDNTCDKLHTPETLSKDKNGKDSHKRGKETPETFARKKVRFSRRQSRVSSIPAIDCRLERYCSPVTLESAEAVPNTPLKPCLQKVQKATQVLRCEQSTDVDSKTLSPVSVSSKLSYPKALQSNLNKKFLHSSPGLLQTSGSQDLFSPCLESGSDNLSVPEADHSSPSLQIHVDQKSNQKDTLAASAAVVDCQRESIKGAAAVGEPALNSAVQKTSQLPSRKLFSNVNPSVDCDTPVTVLKDLNSRVRGYTHSLREPVPCTKLFSRSYHSPGSCAAEQTKACDRTAQNKENAAQDTSFLLLDSSDILFDDVENSNQDLPVAPERSATTLCGGNITDMTSSACVSTVPSQYDTAKKYSEVKGVCVTRNILAVHPKNSGLDSSALYASPDLFSP